MMNNSSNIPVYVGHNDEEYIMNDKNQQKAAYQPQLPHQQKFPQQQFNQQLQQNQEPNQYQQQQQQSQKNNLRLHSVISQSDITAEVRI
jgi:hypothetical protein